ncbi:MAG: polysaccharide deacetylase family protein [Candidatus Omnitrophota bacterium]
MKTLDKFKILYRLGLDARTPKIFSFHDCLPDVFSGYIELLVAKRYQILGAGELLERMSKRDKFRKEVVLTFDDGRRNCWTVVYPLLKKYRIKASMFIIPSRIKDSGEAYPNLEDYWNNKVSWENLYMSHLRQPYLTWRELEIMRDSGLVEVHSHGLRHNVVSVSNRVVDFQHPGVFEMPVYFDEWYEAGMPSLETLWGSPVYERGWAPLASNEYVADQRTIFVMNDFIKNNGGFIFFKKKKWRRRIFDYYMSHQNDFGAGHFQKIKTAEDIRSSIFESKSIIETRLRTKCVFFSLPLYQNNPSLLDLLAEAGYKAVFGGLESIKNPGSGIFTLRRIPGFWLKFLQIF